MSKAAMNVVKGVTAGIVAGVVVNYVTKNAGSKHHMKKKANKAFDTMTEVMDTVSYMLK